MRKLAMLMLVAMMASLVLGATGCCCGVPCDLGSLLGASTMVTSPGDYADIPAYPGSQRLSEVSIPALVKTLVEGMTGGGKFDVKGYGTGDSPDRVAAYYDTTMPTKGWSGSFSSGASTGASGTSQMGQYTKGEDTLALIFTDKDTKTGQTVIIIMRVVVPQRTP